MTEFETSLELLVALGISQLSARPNNERLQRALEVTTRYLELGATRPTISSWELETLHGWMTQSATAMAKPATAMTRAPAEGGVQ